MEIFLTFLAEEGEKIRLSLDQFEALVSQALKEIPQEFLEELENLDIFVEEERSPELLNELGLGERNLVFGLYQGVPRPGKSYFQKGDLTGPNHPLSAPYSSFLPLRKKCSGPD